MSGEISPEVFHKYLEGFTYAPPESLGGARSVLIVATPIGRTIVELDLEDGPISFFIPPTYGADAIIAEAEAFLDEKLGERGSAYAYAWLPLKSLAARSGLARYGRDNVLRFEGAGSFVRLDSWWTELDAEGEAWGPPRNLEGCDSCGACIAACPNGCFAKGRFLVDATKCLTFLNEGSAPFPTWVDARSHNAAVGCLRCQDACPENRNVPGREIYRRFVLDRESSRLLLAGRPVAELPPAAADAVRAAEMVDREANFARNLRALIAARA
jgi:epoxyqueuosine reductase